MSGLMETQILSKLPLEPPRIGLDGIQLPPYCWGVAPLLLGGCLPDGKLRAGVAYSAKLRRVYFAILASMGLWLPPTVFDTAIVLRGVRTMSGSTTSST